jgi:hypothetical protein
MTVKKKWTVVPGFLALAAAATLLSAYSGASSSQGKRVDQPVKFVHAPHVAKAGMNCLYCHSSANKSPDPGNASVATCMGCHLIVKSQSAEIKKVAAYAAKKQPIPWNRVHKVPDYVQFPHMRHVNAGVTCQTCHGQIQNQGGTYSASPGGKADTSNYTNYAPVQQANSLNMGWCINCHVQGYKPADGARAAGMPVTAQLEAMPPKKARYDCAVCHY